MPPKSSSINPSTRLWEKKNEDGEARWMLENGAPRKAKTWTDQFQAQYNAAVAAIAAGQMGPIAPPPPPAAASATTKSKSGRKRKASAKAASDEEAPPLKKPKASGKADTRAKTKAPEKSKTPAKSTAPAKNKAPPKPSTTRKDKPTKRTTKNSAPEKLTATKNEPTEYKPEQPLQTLLRPAREANVPRALAGLIGTAGQLSDQAQYRRVLGMRPALENVRQALLLEDNNALDEVVAHLNAARRALEDVAPDQDMETFPFTADSAGSSDDDGAGENDDDDFDVGNLLQAATRLEDHGLLR